MTTGRAHLIMQTHKECPITACPVKLQAKTHLIHTGRLVPESRPRRPVEFGS
ncbi:hypothetical protein [Nocardia amamiensis]|uniref:hypothetical protein n=1 Tax=Nocardia amamiensis TaxID=404578 RepID=UPI0012F4EC56|nr:hypothetical protein [Nocardia amamiensis]